MLIAPIEEHCWKIGPNDEEGYERVCLLRKGHKGPHEWIREDDILITLLPVSRETQEHG